MTLSSAPVNCIIIINSTTVKYEGFDKVSVSIKKKMQNNDQEALIISKGRGNFLRSVMVIHQYCAITDTRLVPVIM